MFGKKNDEKFEDNFKQLFIITNDLNQRLLNLESQNHHLIQRNQKLEGELNEIKYNINWNRQNLENRITDFTDIWHPLMTDNINRIKKSLEETIMAKENLDIIKIQTELDLKFTNIIKENCVEQISDHILIGFKDNETLPVFIHKNSSSQAIQKFRPTDSGKSFHNGFYGAVLIAQSLKHFKNIKTYDICSLQDLKITDNDYNIIYNPSELDCGCPDAFGKPLKQRLSLEQMCYKRNLKLLKNLLNVFNEMGIKLIMNDSEFVNGVSIRTLIENI
jgi:hypothetical protein